MNATATATVGQLATYTIGSDHYVVEIIAITPKSITTRGTSTIRSGESFVAVPNANGKVRKFTLRQNGRFTMVGGNYGFLNTNVVEDYRDPSF